MKLKIIFPLLCLFFFSLVFPVLKEQGYVLTLVDTGEKTEITEEERQKRIGEYVNDVVRKFNYEFSGEELPTDKIKLKYTDVVAFDDIQFNKTVFGGTNSFYLGAYSSNTVGIRGSTVMRAQVALGNTPSENKLTLIPLAYGVVNINEKVNKKNEYVFVDNPIYNKRVELLNLVGRYPIITTSSLPADPATDNKNVYMITDLNAGKFIKTNSTAIKDAAENPTSGIVNLSPLGSNSICAAVKPQAGSFGDLNSGFAVLLSSEKELKPVNAVTGERSGNKAFSLNLGAGDLLAIDQNVLIGEIGDMHWDDSLQRLFITFVDVRRENNALLGGGISVLVGRQVDNGVDAENHKKMALAFEPIVQLSSSLFVQDSDDFVVGFYDSTVDNHASAYKVRTMHTSTGNTYLIVNGDVSTGTVKNTIYALPLIKRGSLTLTDTTIGKIADKNDFSVLPVAAVNMPLKTEAPVIVGGFGSDPLLQNNQNIQDMFVVGDSVFICLAQNRVSADQESGIFQSSAIFGSDGKIRSWTPFRRVMGSINAVYGGGLDASANFWFLSDEENFKNIVKVTQWGRSAQEPGLMGNGLTSLLGEEFKRENAGVHQIFNFDQKTPSLARTNASDELSFMVATGFEKVALIKTGQGDPFTPTQEKFQTEVPQNVYFWQAGALEQVGPVCCAQVSRIEQEDSGWLFVGGHGGAAVLSAVDGAGWNGEVSAAQIDLDQVAAFTFKFLFKSDESGFSQVRKIVCDGEGQFLYIMTADKLYRVLMDQEKFSSMPVALEEKEIASLGTLLDMLIVERQVGGVRILLATTSGLFVSDLIDDIDENKSPIWTSILLYSGAKIISPVGNLYFESLNDGGFTNNGNLYVIGADFSLNLSTIYRFNVQNGQIVPIVEPATGTGQSSGPDFFYDMGELRSTFVTDGAFGYNLLSKHFGMTDFLRKIFMTGNQSSKRTSEISLNLDLDENAFNIGLIVKNSASGAWIVPCDQGIRGND